MKLLCCLVVLGLAAAGLANTKLPSIDFVGAGLDVTKVAFGGNYIRGALKTPVILHSDQNYAAPTRPADSDWVIPKNLESFFYPECVYDAKSREIQAASDYQHELENVFSASVGYADTFSTTLSTTYRETTQITKELDTVMVDTNVVCQDYEISLKPRTQDLRGVFKNYITGMPKSFDNLDDSVLRAYMDFINEFGTHYVKGIIAGGLMQQRYTMTSFDYHKMEQSGIDVAFEAEISFGIDISVSDTHSETTTQHKNFTATSTHSSVKVTGGDTSKLNDYEAWVPTVINNPVPVFVEVAPIFELLTKESFGSSVYILERQESLKQAIQFYFQRYAQIPDLLPTFNVCERGVDTPDSETVWQNECEAFCPSTHTVISGACEVSDETEPSTARDTWRITRALPNTDANGYRCRMGVDASTSVKNQGARAMALCARKQSYSDLPDNQGILVKTLIKRCTGDEGPDPGLTWHSECTATCPDDYLVTGGGCEPSEMSTGNTPAMVSASGPVKDGNGWFCATKHDYNGDAYRYKAEGYAICTNYTSSYKYRSAHYNYQMLRRESGTTGDTYNSAKATCPSTTVLVGGGCEAYNPDEPKESWRINESWARGQEWTCKAAQDNGNPRTRQNVVATAICMAFDDPNYHK